MTAVGSASSRTVRSPMRIDSSSIVEWTSSDAVASCRPGWSIRSTTVTETRTFGPTRSSTP